MSVGLAPLCQCRAGFLCECRPDSLCQFRAGSPVQVRSQRVPVHLFLQPPMIHELCCLTIDVTGVNFNRCGGADQSPILVLCLVSQLSISGQCLLFSVQIHRPSFNVSVIS